MELNEFKKKYSKYIEKYKLPKFDELNEDFEIDKLEKDTDYLLRAIRKLMMEKIVNSVNFLEMLLNPVNTPRMYLPYIRTIGIEDKQIIDNLYNSLAKLTLISLELEIHFSENGEAELIKKTFSEWKALKPDFKRIIAGINNPKEVVRKERTYFG